MILHQNKETGFWTDFGVDSYGYMLKLDRVHDPALCADRGCAIHDHPSDFYLNTAPMNWREDRGILERICEHGVGHPDLDAAKYLKSIGQGYQNIHGCCHEGCCGK